MGVLCTFKKLPILGQFFWNLSQITSLIVKEMLEFLQEHGTEMGLEWRPVEGNPRAPVPLRCLVDILVITHCMNIFEAPTE